MPKSSILVTGATGFIGLRLTKKLVGKYGPSGITCLVWNNNSAREKEGRKKLRKLGVKVQEIDLSTGMGLENISKSPKIVIHLASCTDTSAKDFSCNDKGTSNLIKALNLNKKSHLVYTSTTASASGRKSCTKSVDEHTKPAPTNEYGRTKYKAEIILQKSSKEQGFALTMVRMPTVYGSSARKDNFFEVINKLADSNSFLSHLDWPGLTSFIYVDDVTDAILRLIQKKPKTSRSHLFVLSAESLTLADVFQLIYKAKGLHYKKIHMPQLFWKFVKKARPVVFNFERILSPKIYNQLWRATLIVDNVIHCDSSKLRRFLPGWKPRKLESVINEVIY